jgi:hypothetical protein
MQPRYDGRGRRRSNALWGLVVAGVIIVIALVFLVNTTGNNAVTASKNIPADSATTGSASSPARSTTGESAPQ